MDWSRERYVRLYTRDTGTWVALSWQARCVLPLLMRKVDRDGRLSLPGKVKPEAIVAKLLDVPVRVVKSGLEDLAAHGIVELTVSGVAIPNFAEAQETRQDAHTAAERAKAYRARKKEREAHVNGSVTPSRDACDGRDASRLAVPNLAVLSHAVPPQPDAHAREEWVEVAAVCDKLPWLHPEGLPALLSPRDRIHRLIASGATASEICDVLPRFGAAVLAGKEPRDRWNAQYVFSGHFDRLRVTYSSVAAPQEETPQETLRRLKGGAP